MRASPLLAAALFSACATYRTISTQDSTNVGDRGSVPEGFASGETTATWVFGLGPFGSDKTERALERARGKRLEAELSDVTVERVVTCVFECQYPLVRRVRVVASGSLRKPTGYKDAERPDKPEPIISQRYPEPSDAKLVERLQSFYLRDPDEAESYYQSLKAETREALGRQVVSQLGLMPLYGDEYRAPSSMSEPQCRFLKWFLHEHTGYRLSAESCPGS